MKGQFWGAFAGTAFALIIAWSAYNGYKWITNPPIPQIPKGCEIRVFEQVCSQNMDGSGNQTCWYDEHNKAWELCQSYAEKGVPCDVASCSDWRVWGTTCQNRIFCNGTYTGENA
jgi:hypothetical protein